MGVYFHEASQTFRASYRHDGRLIRIGRYKTKRAANKALARTVSKYAEKDDRLAAELSKIEAKEDWFIPDAEPFHFDNQPSILRRLISVWQKRQRNN